ncbi:hypothetical protein GCM10009819_30930 [Agromyces tropicus]|uniref:Uncharacterized protein n=1 Tax=Agromyces tropicus TaxID=555371 RepID=A0ABN2UY95_9MICO
MAGLEVESYLSQARAAASAASYDAQKLSEDSIERQAIHNLVTAVEALIAAIDESASEG